MKKIVLMLIVICGSSGILFSGEADISVDGVEWKNAVDQSQNVTPPSQEGYFHKFKIFTPEGLTGSSVRIQFTGTAKEGYENFESFRPMINFYFLY